MLTLVFEKAGEVEITVKVEKITGGSHSGHGTHGDKHNGHGNHGTVSQ
jgi:copper(I)-binding protein